MSYNRRLHASENSAMSLLAWKTRPSAWVETREVTLPVNVQVFGHDPLLRFLHQIMLDFRQIFV